MYDHLSKPQESVPHYADAVSFKTFTNTSEKQQQHIPLVEYAEVDYSMNKSPQQVNLTNGYDEINESKIEVNTEVSVETCVPL